MGTLFTKNRAREKARVESPVLTRRSVGEVLGILDGPSKAGSTYWKMVRRCPREAALYRLGLRGPSTEALDVGKLFHHGLEHYYLAQQRGAGLEDREREALESVQAFQHEEGYEETYGEVERLLTAYVAHVRTVAQDDWEVLAVEENVEYQHGRIVYTSRLDLVVKDREDGGAWLVEHKSLRTTSAETQLGYQMDLQILGQVWLAANCFDWSQLPPFRGVIVNITTKHRHPRVERLRVMPSADHLAAFEAHLHELETIERHNGEMGHPKFFGNCTGAPRYFSRCTYYDICFNRPRATVEDVARDVAEGTIPEHLRVEMHPDLKDEN